MVNKILGFFGVMKISTATQLSTKLHLYYVRCVINGVRDDFGVRISLDIIPKTSIWWRETFNKIIKRNNNDVDIISPALFKK